MSYPSQSFCQDLLKGYPSDSGVSIVQDLTHFLTKLSYKNLQADASRYKILSDNLSYLKDNQILHDKTYIL